MQHAGFLLLLLTGGVLLAHAPAALLHARWLHLKLGLTAFLLLPLEGFHAYVNHVWLAGGLRGPQGPAAARRVERALGLDDMVRSLAVPLLGAAVPLVAWLSLRRPF